MTRSNTSNHIRELRKKAGLTLEQLGAAMPSELTPSTVAKLEKGSMALTLDYIIEVSEALDVCVSDILGIEPPAPTSRIPFVAWGKLQSYLSGSPMNMELVSVPARFVQSTSSFSVQVTEGQAGRLIESGFIVVDRDKTELEAQRWFLTEADHGNHAIVQFVANPPGFIPADTSLPPDPVLLGAKPFTVVGRIVFVGRDV